MKQSNDSWNVTRSIPFPNVLNEEHMSTAMQLLKELPGVRSVSPGKGNRCIRTTYDASAVNFNNLVSVLEEAGLRTKSGWWEGMKRKLFQFSDANARDNAYAPPPSCCNKPPK